MRQKLYVYLLAARPKTLTASVSPVIVGSALAYREQHAFSLIIFFCTLLSAVFLQIASNFFNDAIDHEKGSDGVNRLGPQRVTANGLLPQKSVKLAGILFVVAAILLGIPLVFHGGLPIVLIGLSAAFFSWCYTGGPYPLAYHGLGEVFVLIYYGIVAVGGSAYLQGSTAISDWILHGMMIGSFGMALISLNNFRDIEEDTAANKKTLAVRLGKDTAKLLPICFLIFPFALYAVLLSHHLPADKYLLLSAALPLSIFPYAVTVIKSLVILTPSKECNPLLGKIALAQLFFSLGLSVAICC